MKLNYALLKGALIVLTALALTGCASMGRDGVQVRMSGAEEVPPVTTSASGTGVVRVAEDRSVGGSFKLQNGEQITVAHIHTGAAGQNGPVIITLQKVTDNEWVVPANAKLTDAQYASVQSRRSLRQLPQRQAQGRRDTRADQALVHSSRLRAAKNRDAPASRFLLRRAAVGTGG